MSTIARSSVLRVVTISVLALSLAGCVRYGKGRFRHKKATASRATPVTRALQDVRRTLEPLFGVRGALFLVRLELSQHRASQLVSVLERRLPDAGWVAVHLDKVRAGEQELASIANEIARTIGKEEEQQAVLAALGAVAKRGSMKPSVELEARALVQPERLKQRVSALAVQLERVSPAMARLPGAIESVAEGMAANVRKVGRLKSEAGSDQKTRKAIEVTVEVIAASRAAMLIYEDIALLPTLMAGIKSDLEALADVPAMREVNLEIPDFDKVAAGFDAADLVSRLKRALVPPKCSERGQVTLSAISVQVSPRNLSGGRWDPLGDDPDPILLIDHRRVGKAYSDTRDASWSLNVRFSARKHVYVEVRDKDLVVHDPIIFLPLAPPHRPGTDSWKGHGTEISWTLECEHSRG